MIGRQLDPPARSIVADGAGAHLGADRGLQAMDLSAAGVLTREQLSHQATGPGLIEDLEAVHYFDMET